MKIYLLNHNYKNIGTYFRAKKIFDLLKDHYEVTLICVSEKKISLSFEIEKYKKSKIIYLPRYQYSKYFSGQLVRLFITTYILLTNKIDILYSFAFSQPQISYPSLFKKFLSNKTELIVDWDDLWGNGLGKEHNDLINGIFLFNENFLTKFADRISCASTFLYNYSRKKFNKKIYYLPNFSVNTVNFKKEDTKLKTNHIRFLIIGNIYMNTFDYYLKIFDELFKKNIPFNLEIIGYSDRSFYEEFDYSKRDYIIFHGKVFEDLKKYEIISDITYFLMPTSPTKFDRSRFPIKFIEYLEYFKPIITNKSGEPARYLNKYNNGIILNENLDKDVEKILSNCRNSEIYNKLTSRYIKIYDENFSKNIINSKLKSIIHNV